MVQLRLRYPLWCTLKPKPKTFWLEFLGQLDAILKWILRAQNQSTVKFISLLKERSFMYLFLDSSSRSYSPPLGNFNKLCLDPKSFTWMRICTTSLCDWSSSWHFVTKWQELLRFKNLTLWTNDVDGHIHHEGKRDRGENVPYFVCRLDNEVLNGINFRARELSTSQVRLLFL